MVNPVFVYMISGSMFTQFKIYNGKMVMLLQAPCMHIYYKYKPPLDMVIIILTMRHS